MRKFNSKNANVAGKSMVNGRTDVCAKSNSHRVDSDALCLYLRGGSMLSTRSRDRISSGTTGTSNERARALGLRFDNDGLINGFGKFNLVGNFNLVERAARLSGDSASYQPQRFDRLASHEQLAAAKQPAWVEGQWQPGVVGQATSTSTGTPMTGTTCCMSIVAGSTVGMGLS